MKLLLHQDVNVISVDWGGGSASMYSTSAANTRLVGLEVADMIHFLNVSFHKKSKLKDGNSKLYNNLYLTSFSNRFNLIYFLGQPRSFY